jgi:alpha-L-fucosidase 2
MDKQAFADNKLCLWYRQPAQTWNEALPVGNGRLGAMVYGGMAQEQLALNEDTLWSGRPHDHTNPEALPHLPQVRELIFAGRYAEAQEMCDRYLMGVPPYLQAYQPLGDLWLRFPDHAPATDYRRELDLEDGVVRVSYRVGQATFRREVLSSAVDQVIAVHLTCDQPGQISLEVALASPHPHEIVSQAGSLTLAGQWVGDGENRRLVAGVEGPGICFQVMLTAQVTGGRMNANGEGLSIDSADAATLLLAAATSYRTTRDFSGVPSALCAAHMARAAGRPYAKLRAAHAADYRALYDRVQLDLGDPADDRPTDERLRAVGQGAVDPGLEALYFQYGRYLLISSSRPGTQAANLQGIWNDRLDPPWGSKWTINVNTEMNYWPAEVCNLAECAEPLIDLVEARVPTGQATARAHYDCRGWLLHHNTDIWGAATPVDGSQWGMWPNGAGWLCQNMWEHYLYSGDPVLLAHLYPTLKEAALFYLDFLVEEPQHGWLVTCPSISPENQFRTIDGQEAAVCAGPTMDVSIIRDLFAHLVEASRLLDTDQDLREQMERTLDRLPPYQVGKYGQLQEWLEDFDEVEPGHRHISHLYALYPSDQITLRGTPDLAEAAVKTLERRLSHGGGHTGWSAAWLIALWARLERAEEAHGMLEQLLRNSTFPNLFDTHPPDVFQIDGNFGATAAIAEMLLHSHAGEIVLLPALPQAWPTGSVRGLRARGGFEADIEWQEGRLTQATVRSKLGRSIKMCYGGKRVALETEAGAEYRFDGDLQS